MKKSIAICFLLAGLMTACSSAPKGRSMILFDDHENQKVFKEEIAFSQDPEKKIEFFWSQPSGPGPFPVIVFLHNYQEPYRPGGRDFVRNSYVRKFAQKGVLTVSISQPAYGGTDGPADFAGPRSQAAILDTLEYLKKLNLVQNDRIVLWGSGRGANLAGLTAARSGNYAGLILVSPIFEPGPLYAKLRDSNKEDEVHAAEVMKAEFEPSESGFQERSLMAHANQIKGPVLVLTGAKDLLSDPENVNEFAKLVLSSGGRIRAVVYPTFDYYIPSDSRNAEIIPFLNDVLKKTTVDQEQI